jgi:TolA-binding protein
MVRRLLVLALIASPTLFSADKTTETLLELLRDVGGLQDQIKALQKSFEGKFTDLSQSQADQARATADQVAKSMTALAAGLQKTLQGQQDQQAKTLDTIVAEGSQIQSLSDQLNTMRQATSDLTSAMSRLSTQLNDLSTEVKSMQAAKPDVPGTPPPQISATDLFANAEGDRLGGKLDLALQEYTDYVAKFGAGSQAPTAQAADAQYYIGSIHYSNQEWDDAAKSFDALLQTYPNSGRAPAALYYKADSLARLGRWTDANDVLKDLHKRFPDSPLAKQPLSVKPPAHF